MDFSSIDGERCVSASTCAAEIYLNRMLANCIGVRTSGKWHAIFLCMLCLHSHAFLSKQGLCQVPQVTRTARDNVSGRLNEGSAGLTSLLGTPRLEVDLYRPIPPVGASRLRRRCLRPRGMPGCTHP